VKNNPYATGIVEAFADNIIGWDQGIRLKPTNPAPQGVPSALTINDRISNAWEMWGMPENASADGIESWLELQRLIVKTWVTDGEVFIRKRKGFDNPFAFTIQLIDADLLDEGYNVVPDANGVEIRQGVEMNPDGRPLAYWFWPRHPHGPMGHPGMDRERIPAEEIIHFFVRYRPGQTRGYTLFAPALTTVKMVDGITEAELVATRLAAAKMGFITNNDPDAIAAYAERLKQLNDDAGEGNEVSPRSFDIEPGLTEELAPGQGFEGFDPTHPNGALDVFLKLMLRGVARGFSISYLTATGDVSDANYSSMRAGLLPERDHWRVVQTIFSVRVSRPVYISWLSVASLTPMLPLPGPWTDSAAHEWRPRGWKWVDPLKELLALELAIALGVDSRTRGAAQQGLDYQKNIDLIAEEEAYAEARGVDVSGVKRWDAALELAQLDDDDEGGRAAIVNRLAGISTTGGNNGAHR
jgi:lambda family phage portal protein